jgi:hypothetical protein
MPGNSLHRCDPRQLRCVPLNRTAGMNTFTAALADPAATASRRGVAVAVAASCLGSSFDLFDLFILLYVAPVVGRLFFPSYSPMLSLAAVYAAFAVTMVMRPAGAAVCGRYADLRGRKAAMLAAVLGVGLATASFGALLTVGIESVPGRWRRLVSGSTGLSSDVAALLASLAYFLAATLFPDDRFAVWGWRTMVLAIMDLSYPRQVQYRPCSQPRALGAARACRGSQISHLDRRQSATTGRL